MPGSACEMRRIGLATIIRNWLSKTPTSISRARPSAGPGWLRKRMSIPPSAATACAKSSSMLAGANRSAAMPKALVPCASAIARAVPPQRSESDDEITSSAPSAASASAAARPSPLLAASTSARLPRSPRSMRRLFDADVRVLDDLGEDRAFAAQKLGQLVRRSPGRLVTDTDDTLADIGHAQYLDRFGMEARDDRLRRSGRDDEAVPRRDVEAFETRF